MTYPFFGPAQTGQRRRCVAAYLTAGFLLAPCAARALEPSVLALGRHLAAECTGCHVVSPPPAAGIPSIAGRPAAWTLAALMDYKAGRGRDGRPSNPVMVSVAQSLNEAEMAAVAAYLATLPPGRP